MCNRQRPGIEVQRVETERPAPLTRSTRVLSRRVRYLSSRRRRLASPLAPGESASDSMPARRSAAVLHVQGSATGDVHRMEILGGEYATAVVEFRRDRVATGTDLPPNAQRFHEGFARRSRSHG